MKYKILHLVPYSMNLSGLPQVLMNWYRNIDHSKFIFDFACGVSADSQIEEEINHYGGHVWVLNQSKHVFFHTDLIKKRLLDGGYSAVHMHTAPQIDDARLRKIMRVAKELNIPLRILHFHETCPKKKLPQSSLRLFCKINYFLKYLYPFVGVTHFFACSTLAGQTNTASPFTVVRNAIDTQRFKFNDAKRKIIREQLQISEDEILIGNVGYFSFKKNQVFLLKAFEHLQKLSDKKYKLLFVGNGLEQLQDYISDASLQKNIICLPPQTDIQDYFSAMDIFVLPSLLEGLGLVNIEAQCSGVPSLISDGCAEEAFVTSLAHKFALHDGERALAQLIAQTALSSNELRSQSYEDIEKQGWDIKSIVKNLEDFYTSPLVR